MAKCSSLILAGSLFNILHKVQTLHLSTTTSSFGSKCGWGFKLLSAMKTSKLEWTHALKIWTKVSMLVVLNCLYTGTINALIVQQICQKIQNFLENRRCMLIFSSQCYQVVRKKILAMTFETSLIQGLPVKPGLHLNMNGTRMQHAKTKPSFNVNMLPRRGKQQLAVRRMFREQPNAICWLSEIQR